jgi:hypothetical protein
VQTHVALMVALIKALQSWLRSLTSGWPVLRAGSHSPRSAPSFQDPLQVLAV